MTHYGRTKWEAEQAIAEQLSDWSVLTASLVYGWPQPGCHGNLPTAVISWLDADRPFYPYTDQYRTPIHVEDVIRAIFKLVEGTHPGTHHLGGADWANMYEFAPSVAEVLSLDARRVMPALAPIADSPSALEPTGEISIQRPKLLGLDSTQMAKRLNIRPGYSRVWEKCGTKGGSILENAFGYRRGRIYRVASCRSIGE